MKIYYEKDKALYALNTSDGARIVSGTFKPDDTHKVKTAFDVDGKECFVYLEQKLSQNEKICSGTTDADDNFFIVCNGNTEGELVLDEPSHDKIDCIGDDEQDLYSTVQRFPVPVAEPEIMPESGKNVVYLRENFEKWPEWVKEENKAHDTLHFNYLTIKGAFEHTWTFEPIRAGRQISIEFNYKADEKSINSDKVLYLSGNGQNVVRLFLGRTGVVMSDVKERNKISVHGAKLRPNAWNYIRVLFDVYKKKYDVYFNGNFAYTVPQFDVKTPMEINELHIETVDDGGCFEIDHIYICDPCGTTQPDKPTPVIKRAKVIDRVFADMVGTPNSVGTANFNGHWAELPALTLNTLGIMSGINGLFKPDMTVTRAEFVDILSKALNLDSEKTNKLQNTASDENAKPTDVLKHEEAVAMAVIAMGYEADALALGGYPQGYIDFGNKKYISRGLNIHKGESVTRALAAQMLFYLLGLEIKGTGKSLYDLHSDKAGATIGKKYINAMLQDYYYYREEALEVMMYEDIEPIRIFNSLLNEFKTSASKQRRTRAARVLSEFLVADMNGYYEEEKYDKVYMELLFGKLNVIASADFARAANDTNEDEDVRLYAIRALYLLDRGDLVDKSSWILAFKTKAMTVTRHLSNEAQDILEMHDTEETVDALIAAFDDTDDEVVLRAVDTIGRKGRNIHLCDKAKKAIPALKQLLNHKNQYIVYRAYDALIGLGETSVKEIKPNLQPCNTSTVPVKTTVDGAVVVVNNGNIEVTFDAEDGASWAGMKKLCVVGDDKNLLRGVGFLTWNHELNKNIGIVEHSGKRWRGLICANDEYAEYGYKMAANEMFPYDFELRYRIPRGESGFYVYIVMDKDAASDASQHLYAGVMFRVHYKDWHFCALHDKLQMNIGYVKEHGQIDVENGIKDIYQSAYRTQAGEVDAKHEEYAFQLENHITGMANEKFGFWQIFPSNDSYAKLLKHDMTSATDTMSAMYEGEYFTWAQRPIPAGEYHKFYGPMFVYINKGGSDLDKWEDAKAKLAVEQAKWPYSWVEDEHYFDRGSIGGKIAMSDGSSPKAAYVVVNIPGETKGKMNQMYRTWQQSNGRYNYWTQADENGNWHIDNVHADNYTVTVWKEGYPGETAVENVSVAKGKHTDTGVITFVPYSNGVLAWRVGEPTRTCLYNKERNFNWETHMKYSNRFPNNVNFKVGESNILYDWNYSHPSTLIGYEKLNDWNIIFDVDEVLGDPVITIATCGSRDTALDVLVNGTKIGMLDYGFNYDDSVVMRTGSYGKHIVTKLEFDKSLLKKGENKVTLVQQRTIDYRSSLSYDFIQMEYKTK